MEKTTNNEQQLTDTKQPENGAAAENNLLQTRHEQNDVDDLLRTWNVGAQQVATSMDPKHPHTRALISQAYEAADGGVKDLVGHDVEVIHFFAHVGCPGPDEAGELKAAIRLVFFLLDGRKFSTWSPSVIRGFAFLAAQLGSGPFNPPLLLRFKATKGSKGFSYVTCSEVIREGTNLTKEPPSNQKRK